MAINHVPAERQGRSRFWCLLLLVALGTSTTVGCARGGTPRTVEPAQIVATAPGLSFPTTTAVLGNGLRVLVYEDHTTPLVAACLAFHTGAANDPPLRAGMTHLVEHLVLTKPGDLSPEVRGKFLSEGAVVEDAVTTLDFVLYYGVAPSDGLRTLLQLHSRRLHTPVSGLTDEFLETNRAIILNERRERFESSGYGASSLVIWRELFRDHPYGAEYVGTSADLAVTTVPDVEAFVKTRYVPSNATLIVVGDVRADDVIATVASEFGTATGPTWDRALAADDTVTPFTGPIRRLLDGEAAQPRHTLAWLAPPAFTGNDAVLDILVTVLGNGSASLLHTELVMKRQLAQSVDCEYWPLQLASGLVCNVVMADGATTASVEAAVDEVAAGLCASPLDHAELSRAVALRQTNVVAELEEIRQRIVMLAWYFHYTRDSDYYSARYREFAAVTASDLCRASRRWLSPTNRLSVTVK